MNPRSYSTEPIKKWVKRQQCRLACDGKNWEEWCKLKGLSERVIRRVLSEEEADYDTLDQILTPAGYMVEDLYGWG